jgi:alpha-L-fucosidase
VGNENGIINETNWNLLDTVGFKRGEGAPPNDTLNRGNYNGKHWIGAEADVSIRKGWFYHPNEDSTVKSGATLFDLYLKSVGRGGNMLLNVPPNRAGLISGVDSAALMQFKKIREEAFAHNVFKDAKILRTKNSVEIHLKKAVNFNTLVLKEAISKGQRIVQFEVSGGNNLKFFNPIANGTTIGHKRIIRIPQQSIQYIRILATESKGLPIISEVAAYQVQNTH